MPLALVTLTEAQAIGGIVAVVGSLAGAIGVMFRVGVAHYEAEHNALRAEILLLLNQLTKVADDRNSWRKMNEELVELLNHERARHGGKVVEFKAPVVPESNSPPTEQQLQTAAIATARAKLVAFQESAT